MALIHAILASLSHQAQTGYELARSFDESLGYFWQASHQQIYRELAKLEEQGLLSCELVPQENRPNRKVYALTEPGLAELRDWMLGPGKPMPFKDDLLVKLYAGTVVEPAALLAELAHHQALHGERLAQYEQIEHSHFPRPEALPPQARLIWLTLQAGLSYERSWLAWSELARRTLSDLLPVGRELL